MNQNECKSYEEVRKFISEYLKFDYKKEGIDIRNQSIDINSNSFLFSF